MMVAPLGGMGYGYSPFGGMGTGYALGAMSNNGARAETYRLENQVPSCKGHSSPAQCLLVIFLS
jgi:hypothetical protein